MERLCSWPSWISARIRSHSRKGPERPVGSPDHGCDGETVSPSPQSSSQTSVSPVEQLEVAQNSISRGLRYDARFVVASLAKTVQAMRANLLARAVARTL